MPDIHSSLDARQLAQKKLPWMVFDYIDGAAGEGFGEKLNLDAIQNIRFLPRVLNNVEQRSLNVTVFGEEASSPRDENYLA